MSYWGMEVHKDVLTLPIRRLCGRLSSIGGKVVWIHMRWYAHVAITLFWRYSSSASENYRNLYNLFHAQVKDPDRMSGTKSSLVLVTDEMVELHDAFKALPGHERNFIPRSEYLFKYLQPNLDDLFFIGSDYERLFDRFEVILALEYVHQETRGAWGPVGRFGWKQKHEGDNTPFNILLKEAKQNAASWPLLKAGFFGGSIDRFNEVANKYNEQVLARLPWY